MPNEPVVYTHKSGATRTVRTNEDAVKAKFDGFKPPVEPAGKPSRKAADPS